MSSRRPLTRSFSANGRSGSINGEDISVPSGRADSRNYLLSVRPENSYSSFRSSHYKPSRSAFCSVMAHLAEETQPSFETTLKSKAVSESCNVKFTCVVSGNPTPELTWYKDDMEMDRYCGLPKYEIFQNGKTHTLHIYNCTLEDAAIYQASARNSKGIVSCSGVLEVGTMNEFKIHQRFFAKLKQKADSKRKDLEQSRKRGKENARASPDPLRKRRSPGEAGLNPPSAQEGGGEEMPHVQKPEAEARLKPAEPPAAVAKMPNGFSAEASVPTNVDAHQDVVKENSKPERTYVRETVEIITTKPATKDTLAKKMIKISGGVESGAIGSGTGPGSGKEKDSYEGGMTLARYLTESSHSTTPEDQRAAAPSGVARPTPDLHSATERGKTKQEELEGAEWRTSVPEEKAQVQEPPPKEQESSSALASMFFSLRDIFFRSKNKSGEVTTSSTQDICGTVTKTKEKEIPVLPQVPHSNPSQTGQQEAGDVTEVLGTPAPGTELMDVDEVPPSVDVQEKVTPSPKSQTPECQEEPTACERLDAEGLTPGVTITNLESPSPGKGGTYEGQGSLPREPCESEAALIPAVDSSPKTESTMQLLPANESKVAEDTIKTGTNDIPVGRDLAPAQRRQDVHLFGTAGEHVTAGAAGTHNHGHDACREITLNTHTHVNGLDESQAEPKTGQLNFDLDSMGDLKSTSECHITPKVNLFLTEVPMDVVSEKDTCVSMKGEVSVDGNLGEQENRASVLEEQGEMGRNEPSVSMAQTDETKDLLQTQGDSTPTDMPVFVEEKASVEEKEIPMDSAQKNEMGELLEKAAVDMSADPLPVIQIEPPDVPQPEEAMKSDLEVSVLEPRLATSTESTKTKPDLPTLGFNFQEVPQGKEVGGVTATTNLESRTEVIVEPPTSTTTDDIHVSEQPSLQTEAPEVPALVTSENRAEVMLVTPVQQVARSDEDTEVLKGRHYDQDVKTTNETAGENVSNERDMVSANHSVPVISVSFEDNSEFCKSEAEQNGVEPTVGTTKAAAALPKVPTFVIPPISITCTENTPEGIQPSKDELKETESLVSLLRGVKSDLDIMNSHIFPSEPSKMEPSSVLREIMDAKQSDNVENTRDSPLEVMIPKPVDKPKMPLIVPDLPMEKTLPHGVKTEPGHETRPKDSCAESDTFVNQLQKEKPGLENFSTTLPEVPVLSPTTVRKFGPRGIPGLEAPGLLAVPAIRVDSSPTGENKVAEEGTGRYTPTTLSCESSPRMKRRDSQSLIPSATPAELASGARRKIFIPKTKGEEVDGAQGALEAQVKKEESPRRRSLSQSQEAPYMSPSQSRRSSFLQPPSGQQTPTEKRSPLLSRKKTTLEVPKLHEKKPEEADTPKTEGSSEEKDKLDPFKAPQVIRKIRGEPFSDASGHLRLWCQFFNVLSDSTIKWYRDEVEIAKMFRSAGDESEVSLAIVQTSSRDCGVYGCSIKNEYGTDTTDFLLSADILSEFLLREDLEVGEEIEMTPMLFTKGLADPGSWGNKLFGRIMIEESHVGEGCAHKACRVKVIYGLEPIFESGSTCIIKVRNPIAYGRKDENNLVERNLEITKQDCKIQNMIREYCKVFAAEARVVENFGPVLEVIPLYLMYRPANTIPYATVESDLKGIFLKYSLMDAAGRLIMRTGSEVEQKCCTFQHWIHQWTNGNLLVTQIEGVGMKITNVGVTTKSKGYQGLSDSAMPKVFEQFVSQHQCNYYCGLLGLRTLKTMDSLQQPGKLKASRSPLLNRRAGPGSSSPQLQRKGLQSPQTGRRLNPSPKVARKADSGDSKSTSKNKTTEAVKEVKMS